MAGLALLITAGAATGMVGGQAGAGAATSASAPGVTSTQITVGAVATTTGTLAATFDGFVPGMQAYFKMVDAQGGVDGRKIVLPTSLVKNTSTTASAFTSLAKGLVEQDHVFAMAVSTFVPSSPGFLGQTTVPTFGFDANGLWAGPKNLFAYGGSVLYVKPIATQLAFLMKKTKSAKLGVLSYNIASSKDACTTAATTLKKAGYTVPFVNLSAPLRSTYSSTVQRMKSAGVTFVLSCMQDTDALTLSRDIHEYHLNAKQYWLTSGGQKVINKYPTLTTGMFQSLTAVPFGASTADYPGLKKYRTSMTKYSPSFVNTQNGIRGWASGALLVAGIKAAGSNLTQKAVVQAINKMSHFNATTLITPVHWTSAHTKSVGPWCTAYVQVQNKVMVPKFGKGKQVFSCFQLTPKHPTPVKPPPNTPGAT